MISYTASYTDTSGKIKTIDFHAENDVKAKAYLENLLDYKSLLFVKRWEWKEKTK